MVFFELPKTQRSTNSTLKHRGLQKSTDITLMDQAHSKYVKFEPRMIEGGLVVAAPPCSLYSAVCQSVHQRTKANPAGNVAVYKVRLAHRIWANMAPGLI